MMELAFIQPSRIGPIFTGGRQLLLLLQFSTMSLKGVFLFSSVFRMKPWPCSGLVLILLLKYYQDRDMAYGQTDETSDPVNHDSFEKRALQITGGAFYLLAAGLVATSALNIYKGGRPETTFWGIVVSVISILSMWLLIHYKVKIGKQYNSQALISDANCSKACMYLSIILLVSSVGYEVTGIGAIDSIGANWHRYFSYREGREAFEKAKGSLTCVVRGNASRKMSLLHLYPKTLLGEQAYRE